MVFFFNIYLLSEKLFQVPPNTDGPKRSSRRTFNDDQRRLISTHPRIAKMIADKKFESRILREICLTDQNIKQLCVDVTFTKVRDRIRTYIRDPKKNK